MKKSKGKAGSRARAASHAARKGKAPESPKRPVRWSQRKPPFYSTPAGRRPAPVPAQALLSASMIEAMLAREEARGHGLNRDVVDFVFKRLRER